MEPTSKATPSRSETPSLNEQTKEAPVDQYGFTFDEVLAAEAKSQREGVVTSNDRLVGEKEEEEDVPTQQKVVAVKKVVLKSLLSASPQDLLKLVLLWLLLMSVCVDRVPCMDWTVHGIAQVSGNESPSCAPLMFANTLRVTLPGATPSSPVLVANKKTALAFLDGKLAIPDDGYLVYDLQLAGGTFVHALLNAPHLRSSFSARLTPSSVKDRSFHLRYVDIIITGLSLLACVWCGLYSWSPNGVDLYIGMTMQLLTTRKAGHESSPPVNSKMGWWRSFLPMIRWKFHAVYLAKRRETQFMIYLLEHVINFSTNATLGTNLNVRLMDWTSVHDQVLRPDDVIQIWNFTAEWVQTPGNRLTRADNYAVYKRIATLLDLPVSGATVYMIVSGYSWRFVTRELPAQLKGEHFVSGCLPLGLLSKKEAAERLVRDMRTTNGGKEVTARAGTRAREAERQAATEPRKAPEAGSVASRMLNLMKKNITASTNSSLKENKKILAKSGSKSKK